MKDEISIVLGVLVITLNVYSIVNYDKLVKRHLKAFYLNDEHTVAKNAIEFGLKMGFVLLPLAAIYFFLEGFGVI